MRSYHLTLKLQHDLCLSVVVCFDVKEYLEQEAAVLQIYNRPFLCHSYMSGLGIRTWAMLFVQKKRV